MEVCILLHFANMDDIIVLTPSIIGVSDIPNCTNPRDFTCKLMRSMVHSGVYTDYVQNRIIQAQYYRDPKNEQSKYC